MRNGVAHIIRSWIGGIRQACGRTSNGCGQEGAKDESSPTLRIYRTGFELLGRGGQPHQGPEGPALPRRPSDIGLCGTCEDSAVALGHPEVDDLTRNRRSCRIQDLDDHGQGQLLFRIARLGVPRHDLKLSDGAGRRIFDRDLEVSEGAPTRIGGHYRISCLRLGEGGCPGDGASHGAKEEPRRQGRADPIGGHRSTTDSGHVACDGSAPGVGSRIQAIGEP